MTKKIVGYTDVLSVAPGEAVRFMVSCDPSLTHYETSIVRMLSGDSQPGGPRLRHVAVATEIEGRYPAREQKIHPGSFVVVPDRPAFQALCSLTVRATILPTLPGGTRQSIVSKFDPGSQAGFELFIDEIGRLALQIGDGKGGRDVLTGDVPLRARAWCVVTASFEHRTGTVRLDQAELPDGLQRIERHGVERRTAIGRIGRNEAPALIAGAYVGNGCHKWATSCFNGRVERPVLYSMALGGVDAMQPVAEWDFSIDISTDRVTDVSGNECHGRTVNTPVRAMRGQGWNGATMCWPHDPSQYPAIHFHDDDIHDCDWQADFALTVPPNLPSGFYAAWLRSGDSEDYLPFFVRPARGQAVERLALLVPTISYLAYANWRLPFESATSELLMNALPVLGDEDRYLLDHPEVGPSLYDTHNDGTSALRASRLRPNLNMRPTHPWLEQYPADLLLVDWLEHQGIRYDVITDEDLHEEGAALLGRYRCVMTGTHPEYYSTPMWDGMHEYLQGGGRLMYMGGNGFVWRVGVDPLLPGSIELRRGEAGSSVGSNEPGEYHMASTGEYGGLWSRIGRPPQRLVGVGYVAQGFDFSASYQREAGAQDPRAAFVFAGIVPNVVIGNFGLQGHGAAGVEIDRFDATLGTPRHALRLATSAGRHTGTYRVGNLAGLDQPELRSDLVFFETPMGGAVFSVGSMAWGAALSHADYENDVSRITDNIVRRFLDSASF